jgi:hypothetical protein
MMAGQYYDECLFDFTLVTARWSGRAHKMGDSRRPGEIAARVLGPALQGKSALLSTKNRTNAFFEFE